MSDLRALEHMRMNEEREIPDSSEELSPIPPSTFPADAIGIVDAISMLVAIRHGDEWIAPIDIYKHKGREEYLIKGPPDFDKAAEFHGVARIVVRRALRAGRLVGYATLGAERVTIAGWYWKTAHGDNTLDDGRVRVFDGFNGEACFLKRDEWYRFVSKLKRATEPKREQEAASDAKAKPQAPEEKASNDARANGEGGADEKPQEVSGQAWRDFCDAKRLKPGFELKRGGISAAVRAVAKDSGRRGEEETIRRNISRVREALRKKTARK
jgi:hypothetical protein